MIAPSQSEIAFWALKGTMGAVPFAWSTAAATGYDPRLLEAPSAFSIGPATTISSPPERATTSLVLDNADGALSQYVIGTTGSAAMEFQGPSFLGIRAKLYRVTVENGVAVEKAYTPTLVLSGGLDVADKAIRLTLAADDAPTLGPSVGIRTVEDVLALDGEVVWNDGGGGLWRLLDGGLVPADFAWTKLRADAVSSMESVVPYLYGNTAVRLLPLNDGPQERFYIVGFLHPAMNGAFVDHRSSFWWSEQDSHGSGGMFIVRLAGNAGYLLCSCLDAEKLDDKDRKGEPWLLRTDAEGDLETIGVDTIVMQILEDHAEAGASAYDFGSLNRAGELLSRYRGVLAGVVASETTVREILEYICAPTGLRVWIGVDDKLHFAARDVTHDEIASIGELAIERMYPWDDYPATTDGMPSWTETVPSGPDDIGAAASRVTIDWPEWALQVYPRRTRDRRMAGKSESLAPYDAELRVSGEWLHPALGRRVLDSLVDRSTYPVRIVSMAMHVAIAERPIGSIMRLTHPFGIGGFEERAVRLIRVEVRPGEHAAIATFEDLGPVEALRVGKLDSVATWVRFNPSTDGLTLETDYWEDPEGIPRSIGFIHGGSSPPPGKFLFSESDVGRTIWGPPSTHPDYLGVTSYRIVSVDMGPVGVDQGCGVVLHPPMAESYGAIPASSPSTPALDANWLVMRTGQADPGHREDYITGSDIATGAGRGWQFVRG